MSLHAARAIDAVKIYGSGPTAVRALDGVDAEFERGRFTAIMGPSGSGKSTLLHCLAGLDHLTSGTVMLGDVDLGTLDDRDLTPTLDALENIVLPLSIAGRAPDSAWLDSVVSALGLSDRLGHRPSELSGGQQQRVAVARALVSRPEIVFADEPSGNLDSQSGAQLLELLRRAVDVFEQTVVMVTHDATAASFSDRVVFLGDGRIVDELREPTAERILDRIKRLEA